MTGKMIKWNSVDLVQQVQSVSRANENGCWIWGYGVWAQGVPDLKRYPRITIGGKQDKVSRWVLQAVTGRLGEQALHSCDTPACVNPEHLRWGDHAANVEDARSRARYRPAAGDDHWTRKAPERVARGDRNGSRTRPDRLSRGERHSQILKSRKEKKKMQ